MPKDTSHILKRSGPHPTAPRTLSADAKYSPTGGGVSTNGHWLIDECVNSAAVQGGKHMRGPTLKLGCVDGVWKCHLILHLLCRREEDVC